MKRRRMPGRDAPRIHRCRPRPASPAEVTSGPPLAVPGYLSRKEGNAELIAGAAVRRARTPFGKPDQRRRDEAVPTATRLRPAATKAGVATRAPEPGFAIAFGDRRLAPVIREHVDRGQYQRRRSCRLTLARARTGRCRPPGALDRVEALGERRQEYDGPVERATADWALWHAPVYTDRGGRTVGFAGRKVPSLRGLSRCRTRSEVRYHRRRGWRGSAPASLVLCENTLDWEEC